MLTHTFARTILGLLDVPHADDPNWGGKMADDEAFIAGNYGTLVFDANTGQVRRYYVSEEGPEYADVYRIDVASYRNRQGNPIAGGDGEDIIFVGFWLDSGEYEPPAEPDPAGRFVEEVNANLKRMYGIDLNDTGFTEADVRRWYTDGKDASVHAQQIGKESDLDRIDSKAPYGGH